MNFSVLSLMTILVFVSAPRSEAQSESNKEAATFWCANEFTGQLVSVGPQSTVDSCVASLVWGAANICYTGSGQELVDQINSKKYQWLSSGYLMVDAKMNRDAIEFTGYDSRSFYSSLFDVFPCSDSN